MTDLRIIAGDAEEFLLHKAARHRERKGVLSDAAEPHLRPRLEREHRHAGAGVIVVLAGSVGHDE